MLAAHLRSCDSLSGSAVADTSAVADDPADPMAELDPIEEGDAPVPYRPSYMFGLLARRATKNAHAVQWPEGTIQQHPEEHVTGGDISQGECARLAKHLSESFGTIGLVPKACRGVLGRGP